MTSHNTHTHAHTTEHLDRMSMIMTYNICTMMKRKTYKNYVYRLKTDGDLLDRENLATR